MSYTQEREQFIARMSRDGMRLDTITTLLRYASTLQRLAVAQCNGDYPANNGQRKVVECSRCGSHWAPESMVRDHSVPKVTGPGEDTPHWIPLICRDCRTQEKVKAICPPQYHPVFGGDPRGAVLRLVPAEASEEDVETGRERGIYVPARER